MEIMIKGILRRTPFAVPVLTSGNLHYFCGFDSVRSKLLLGSLPLSLAKLLVSIATVAKIVFVQETRCGFSTKQYADLFGKMLQIARVRLVRTACRFLSTYSIRNYSFSLHGLVGGEAAGWTGQGGRKLPSSSLLLLGWFWKSGVHDEGTT